MARTQSGPAGAPALLRELPVLGSPRKARKLRQRLDGVSQAHRASLAKLFAASIVERVQVVTAEWTDNTNPYAWEQLSLYCNLAREHEATIFVLRWYIDSNAAPVPQTLTSGWLAKNAAEAAVASVERSSAEWILPMMDELRPFVDSLPRHDNLHDHFPRWHDELRGMVPTRAVESEPTSTSVAADGPGEPSHEARRSTFRKTLESFATGYDPGVQLDTEALSRDAATAQEAGDIQALLGIARQGIEFEMGHNRDPSVDVPDYDAKNDELYATIEAYASHEEALIGTGQGGSFSDLFQDLVHAASAIHETARGNNAIQHWVNTLALNDGLARRHDFEVDGAAEMQGVVDLMRNEGTDGLTPGGVAFLERCRR